MRLVGIILDLVPIEMIKANTEGPDHTEFEAEVIESVKKEGFYNPISTHIRTRNYRYNPDIHYLDLGNHRYWMAKEAGMSHLWCLARVWNCQLNGIQPGAYDQIKIQMAVIPTKEPPWDVRDFRIDETPLSDLSITKARARQESPEGKFTGRMIIRPDLKVSMDQPLNLEIRNQTKTLLE